MATVTYNPPTLYLSDYPYSTLNLVHGSVATFTAPSGETFIVDADDFDAVSQLQLCVVDVHKSRGPDRPRYLMTSDGQYLHRVLLGLTDRRQKVDHRNGDGLDNRRANLRVVSNGENIRHSPKCRVPTTSRFKGVSRSAGKKWRAGISCDRRTFHLGYFRREEDAAVAYNAAARVLFGQFAFLNVIDDSNQQAA